MALHRGRWLTASNCLNLRNILQNVGPLEGRPVNGRRLARIGWLKVEEALARVAQGRAPAPRDRLGDDPFVGFRIVREATPADDKPNDSTKKKPTEESSEKPTTRKE